MDKKLEASSIKMGTIMWRLSKQKDWIFLSTQFTWIQDMEGVPQDPIFHAEGDVATHTRMVVEALQQLPEYQQLSEQEQEILFAAALLHDVEKRSTTLVESDGRITSKYHARRGEYTARTILYQAHATPFLVKETIAKLVRYHGLPLWIFEKSNPKKALLQASLEVDTALLYILAKADVLGRICKDQADLLYKVELFKAFCEEQNCFGKAPVFGSDFGRYLYFTKEDGVVNYTPYEADTFEVIMLSALPGSGKDFFIKKHYHDWPVISIDELRRTNNVSPKDKKGNGRMVQLAKERARIHLRKRIPFVWNATNITRSLRQQLIQLFQEYGAKTKLIYLEVPYKQLLSQNQNRAYPVPKIVLEKMIRKLEVPALWEAPVVELGID